MKKINFKTALKDAFGEVVNEGKENQPVILNKALINMLSHPKAIPDGITLDGESILKRLTLQQKIAADKEQEYGTDELTVIRESVVNLFNNRLVSVELAGTILEITK